jgi:hypothetical protein
MLFDPYTYDLTTAARQRRLPNAQTAHVLLEVPQEARAVLWHGLRDAAEHALDLWDSTPSGVRRAPQAVSVQHAGQPRFHPDHLRAQTLPGWHRLMGLELGLAAQEVETLILAESAASWAKLAEQCARIGQLYGQIPTPKDVGL